MNQIAYDNTTPQGTRTIEYLPQGVCSRLIKIEVDAGKTTQASYPQVTGLKFFL